MSRYGANPLDQAPGWHQGVTPGGGAPHHHEPEPAPELLAGGIDNVAYMLMARASRIVRQRYGIKDPFAWSRNAAFYDRIAQRVYRNLQQGKDPWARG